MHDKYHMLLYSKPHAENEQLLYLNMFRIDY